MIAFSHFHKRYGARVAVEDLSMDVRPGEVVALFGPNGSGKSTSLKAVAGLIQPTSGTISVDGEVITPAHYELRRKLAYLPQRLSFDDHMTVGDILQLYAGLRAVPLNSMRERCDSMGLGGLDKQPAASLSGGQSQRLALTIALAGDVGTWLLDEPTAGLDSEAAEQLRAMVVDHRHFGGSVLISSHMLSDIERLADRVAVMREGRLLALRDAVAVRKAIASATTLEISFLNPDGRYQDIARQAGAEILHARNGTLKVSAPPEERLRVLKDLEAAGAMLERFSETAPSAADVVARWTEDAPRDE